MKDISWSYFIYSFSFTFVQRALIVGIVVALCSSLLGVTLVLKRFSLIGDGLSHVAFGASSVAAILSIVSDMAFVLPVTIVCAILLLRTGQNTHIKGDAAVAMISVGALALGYLLMNMFPVSGSISGDVCASLFGSVSILTITKTELWLSIGLSATVIVLFVLFYNKIFSVTFDENFAQATGVKATLYNLIIAVIVAVIIVLAMKLVGSLLVSALIVFPALSAMRVFKTFLSVTICSAVLSVVCTLLGLLSSILFGTPVGPSIVVIDILVFAIFSLVGIILRRKTV